MTALFKTLRLLTAAILIAAFFAGCGSGARSDRFDDNVELIGAPASTSAVSGPEIVHIDTAARIATFRPDGSSLDGEYFHSVNLRGEETGVIKLIPSASTTGLRTADILEGTPAINDRIRVAGPEDSERLAALYPEAEDTFE